MHNNVIITISRQYGSNGKEIGRKLAEYLDIGYYNKEIMEKIAIDMGIDPHFFSGTDKNDLGLYTLPEGHGSFSTMAELSVNSKVYEMAESFIKGISERESAVIVGRCADYILRENKKCISVFFYSDIEDRVRWSIKEYHVPEKKAHKLVLEKDKQRAGFYEFYTNQHWGQARNYDIMINTSKMKEEEIIEMLSSLYDAKAGIVQMKGAFENQYIQEKDRG